MPENRKERLQKAIIAPDMSISEAIEKLDYAGTGILLICDPMNLLQGVITDGDIRRAILHSLPLSDHCITIANTNPVYARQGISVQDALFMMDHAKKFYVNHLPVVDIKGKVVDLLLRRDFLDEGQIALQAVIMAGGFGTRLRPMTEDVPKPMIPVGEKPVLEHIINRLSGCGIKEIKITTHYLSDKIKDYFGDGKNFDVTLDYINEENPLGTAGALSQIEDAKDPLLVINGDILTDIDFGKMFEFHREQRADLTVGVRRYEFQVPYGVIQCEGSEIQAIHEKPLHQFFVNAGIYILQPQILTFIPKEQRYDMTDLIKRLISENKNVVSFPIREYWLDIGQPTDLEKALKDYSIPCNSEG